MDQPNVAMQQREPWNKGKRVGQKSPFKLKEIWAIRIRLQLANCTEAVVKADSSSAIFPAADASTQRCRHAIAERDGGPHIVFPPWPYPTQHPPSQAD